VLSTISAVLIFLSILGIVPVAIVVMEVLAALFLPEEKFPVRFAQKERPRIAILIPAHNEGRGLIPTVQDLQSQTCAGDRILVVADNCTDDTASVAASVGASVIERHDVSKFGKGYALGFGVRALRADPPDVVIIVDADCRLAADAIDRLASTCLDTGRPVQARYLMLASKEAGFNQQVAEFAWRLKNWIRPLGLSKLYLPCQLVGSGMAFPWKVIDEAQLDNGWLVEDLKLGIDLAMSEYAPIFCPSAICVSEFAQSSVGAQSQRQRWEQGHVGMILKMPGTILKAVSRLNFGPVVLAADLIVPPLTLLVLMIFGMLVITAALSFLGLSSAPFFISLLGAIAFSGAVFGAWLKHGQDILPAKNAAAIILYIFRKIPLYAKIFSGRLNSKWVRTDRGGSFPPEQ